uniref:AF4/FMR2 family, member 2 n=1 Tax=Cyclopterus lumpus TaxID=8103 RepID=A0A8C3A761_CYCLU
LDFDHLESDRSALKRREWERRNQEVQQDEDLFSTGFNLFGEPYKTNKGDALASRVQNTLGSYEEMKDLLTSHSNQSHLVGIPKGSNNLQTPTTSTTERPPPAAAASSASATATPHPSSKMSRSSMDWSRAGHGQSTQGGGLVLGLAPVTAATGGRGKLSLMEEQQMQRHDELFSSLKDELDGGNFRSSTVDGGHFKSSTNAENGGHFKSSPFENETSSHLSTSSSPLASTSVLTTPTPGLTTPTSGLTTPTFPPGSLSGKPMAIQQKPTAYVRPMDGQDQVPSDSPQMKPPLVPTEGFNNSQAYGGNAGNAKNKLPKLSLGHTGEVRSTVTGRIKLHITNKCLSFFLSLLVSFFISIFLCFFLSGASGSSSESESSSESDTDESESSSSDSEYNQTSRTHTPEPEPPSANKWQLDSWLNKVQAQTKPLVPPQEKDLLPPPSLELQTPPRPRSKPPSGKTAPRKEPRSDKRKHRGPSSKITPKSREFIETDSSSSSSECHSDSEGALKILALPPQEKHSAINTQTLSHTNAISGGTNALSIGNRKDPVSMSPPPNVRHEVAPSPLREFQEIQSLWVKVELSLLGRVPGQGLGERSRTGQAERDGSEGRDRERTGVAERERQKQAEREWPALRERQRPPKGEKPEEENERLAQDRERQGDRDRLTERERPTDSQDRDRSGLGERERTAGKDREKTSSLNRKQSRRREDKLLPPLLSPLSDDPPPKRTCDSGSSLGQEGVASGTQPCSISTSSSTSTSTSSSSSSHRHRRGEGKASAPARNGSVSAQRATGLLLCPCNALTLSRKSWTERNEATRVLWVHSADYYMQEAKRLKHKADALTDKFGKAVNYADGALSFIECGNAMERDPLEAKSPYTMYSETVELIRYAMRLKNFTSQSATVAEKKLAVLCNRCLSLLYLRMFHLKKDHAVKYSRSLMEYFKVNSAKSSHQAPSPWRINGKVNGTPSPLSLSPSPAGSGGAGGGGAPGSSGSVAIPQRIHHMAASHVNITNNILRSYEHWETADRLAADSQEFFQELDSVMEPLSQQSSMTELVRYIRQGLHWLRSEAHLL